MKPVVTAQQMAAMDRYSIENLMIPGIVLMENAGYHCARIAQQMLQDLHGKVVHIYCGPGNNGGDGYVIARHLANWGAQVHTLIAASRDNIKGDALINLAILEQTGHVIHYIASFTDLPAEKPDLVVDALLGTGASPPLRGFFKEIVEHINGLDASVLAVDVPTGVSADHGVVSGHAIRAQKTVTMACLKPGLLLSPGREHCGSVEVVDISMPPHLLQRFPTQTWQLERDDIKARLPARSPDAHKNKCGSVGVVAGSIGFTGAAILTSLGVLRAGAGLAYLAIPASLNVIAETKATEVITWPIQDAGVGWLSSECFGELLPRLEVQTVIAIGPGLGQNAGTAGLVQQLLGSLKKPLVLDADGLSVCAGRMELLRDYPGEMVLTPHPGELSRLTGLSTVEISQNRIVIAREKASEWGKVLVLKGGPTIVALPDGQVFLNSTGNAGMATAGSGDVLTGIIAGLMAQGLDAENAAITGVYLHGFAGDLARIEKGEMGLIAGDILEQISYAIKMVQNDK